MLFSTISNSFAEMLPRGCKSWLDLANINMYLQDIVPTDTIKYGTVPTTHRESLPSHITFWRITAICAKNEDFFFKQIYGKSAVKNSYCEPLPLNVYGTIS